MNLKNAKLQTTHYQLQTRKGFTLIEIMVSVALIMFIVVAATPVYQGLQNRNDLDIATTTVAQTIRRAQILSQAVDGDTSWGVHIQSSSISLFKGVSFAERDTDSDELFEISPSLSFSGMEEIVFAKFSGEPQTTGNVVLTSLNNETRTITINEKGTISY